MGRPRGPSTPEKLIAKSRPDSATGCRVWTGDVDKDGYGFVWTNESIAETGRGRTKLAHRAAWEVAHGPIPEGTLVCHSCDNPPCIEVSHLFLGTNVDNMHDRDAKGRNNAARGERHRSYTHPESYENVKRLTAPEVLQIRHLATRGLSQRDLARAFGISYPTVNQIINRVTWKHV
jgi:hypothetical protein